MGKCIIITLTSVIARQTKTIYLCTLLLLVFTTIIGTTWLGEILYLLIGDINLDAIEKMMCYSRVLWLDDKRSHKLLPDFPQPRLMKSHLLPEMMPPSAFSCRIVLAIRNVKDVVVALYHFYKMNSHFGNFEKSFEEFACMFVDGYMHWGDWARHVYSWWQKTKDSQNILPVFYEETKANPRETVRKLAEFLNKKVSDDDVEQIVEATSFTKMKARPTTNLEHNKSISLALSLGKGKWVTGRITLVKNKVQSLMLGLITVLRIRNFGNVFRLSSVS